MMPARPGVALIALLAATQAALARPVVIYGTEPGMPAYDADPFGGNPFATAVIAALDTPDGDLDTILTETTALNSDDGQFPDTSGLGPDTALVPQAGENAVALVVVISDYGGAEGLKSLPGAAFDANRVAGALARAGYSVRTLDARSAQEYIAAIDSFALEAGAADRALVYTTAHGLEVGGEVYLVPPEAENAPGNAMLAQSVRLSEVEARLSRNPSTVLLYAGCRDNPFGL